MSTSTDIKILPLLFEHRQSVINLLLSSFFIEEPINTKLEFNIPQEVLSWTEYLVDTGIHGQCSFVAIDTNSSHKNVIGVILNGISNRTQTEETMIPESEKLRFVFHLLDKLFIGYDLYEIYQIDRLFHCDVINIDENYRGQHLSTRLIEASDVKAQQMGLNGGFVICTSLFSKKAFQRHGYQLVNELLYSEHGNGQLTNMGEHDRCSLLYKRF